MSGFDAECALNDAVSELRLGKCELGGDNIASCPECRAALSEAIAKAFKAGRDSGVEEAAAASEEMQEAFGSPLTAKGIRELVLLDEVPS